MRLQRWIHALFTLILSMSLIPGFAELIFAADDGPDLSQWTYRNPLMDVGLADPAVMKASDGRYYMVNTFGFTIHSSDDLVNWKVEGSAHPAGSWGVADFWAPEMIEYDGRFYLFYSAERREGGKRIGVAVSDRPTGGFVDLGRPLFDFGYPVIDAHPFVDDDGRIYLFFAKDQVSIGGRHESHIYGVELAQDMISVIGEPVLLSRPEQPWEFRSGSRVWNEGPWVIKHDGTYYLMFSANCFCGRDYSVGYATADAPLGPYVKYEDNPILSRGSWLTDISGPGHHSVIASPDGSELFMVYHIHAEPLVGGGERRLSIDRMGFRPDGSLYVSGPTLTPQPKPSGTIPLINVAGTARVTVSSVKPGHYAAAIIDGEVVVDAYKQRYDWVSDGEQQGAWVRLNWDLPQRVRAVFVYGSVLTARRVTRATVRLSDGTEISLHDIPVQPGAAAIAELPDDRAIDWLEIIIDEMHATRGEAALSEVVVLGYPLGSVWFSSPKEGRVVTTDPIRVEAHGVPVAQVTVKLNDEVIYQGERLPQDLALHAAAMPTGKHKLVATVIDQDGNEHVADADLSIAHVAIPSLPWGTRLRGTQLIQPQLVIPEDELASVAIHLRPVGDRADDLSPVFLHEGQSMPDHLLIDTLTIADGAYDLSVEVTTTHGIASTLETRVLIDNWEMLHDPIPAPSESGWFGLIEHLKVVDRFGQWEYSVGDEAMFFGDGDRIRAGAGGSYLTWRHARMRGFEIITYAQEASSFELMLIRVSHDGAHWTDIDFETELLEGPNEHGWSRYKLTGSVTADETAAADVEYFRLEVLDTDAIDADPRRIEIGDVRLRAPKGS